MNFNLDKEQTFARALKPNDIQSLTKNWSTIEGYVYIISKVMPPHEGDPPLNCVKVGFSNITTRDKFDKGYARLLSFRTSLISFKVHRIYLFEANDFDAGKKEAFGLSANMAEQMLHRLIDDKFKPKQVRLKFSNKEKSEWWNVKEKQMDDFLKFCDTRVQLDTSFPPVYGTRFTRNKSYPIKFPKRVMGVGVYVDEDNNLKSKDKYRKSDNKYAKNLRVRKTAIAIYNSIKAEKEVNAAKRRELEKTVKFWEGQLLNKKFTDRKKMHPEDRRLWGGKKVIDSVFRNKGEQIHIGYAPDVAGAQKSRAKGDSSKQVDIDDASGYLTVNEALIYFPSLKKKFKASYDYYVKKNKYEEDYDYTESFS